MKWKGDRPVLTSPLGEPESSHSCSSSSPTRTSWQAFRGDFRGESVWAASGETPSARIEPARRVIADVKPPHSFLCPTCCWRSPQRCRQRSSAPAPTCASAHVSLPLFPGGRTACPQRSLTDDFPKCRAQLRRKVTGNAFLTFTFYPFPRILTIMNVSCASLAPKLFFTVTIISILALQAGIIIAPYIVLYFHSITFLPLFIYRIVTYWWEIQSFFCFFLFLLIKEIKDATFLFSGNKSSNCFSLTRVISSTSSPSS